MSSNPQLVDVTTAAITPATSSGVRANMERILLQSFTCFSSLPKELRLQIFRETFGRPNSFHLDGKTFYPWRDPNGHKGPVTLHVCQESRKEALRFYQIVLQAEYDKTPWEEYICRNCYNRNCAHNRTPQRRPAVPEAMWFSGKRDSAHIVLDQHNAPDNLASLLKNLQNPLSSSRQIISTVGRLDIRIISCCCLRSMMPIISFNHIPGRSLRPLLLYFEALEQLCITCEPPYHHARFDHAWISFPDDVLTGIKAWLEQNKAHFRKGKAPEVYLAPHAYLDAQDAMPEPRLELRGITRSYTLGYGVRMNHNEPSQVEGQLGDGRGMDPPPPKAIYPLVNAECFQRGHHLLSS